MFFGIGVGPGEPGLIPVLAWDTLKKCHVIFVPRARTMNHSVARGCLPTDEIPQHRFREIEFAMETDRSVLSARYTEIAETIAVELRAGRDVAYLTLGDPSTYSTYTYTLSVLQDRITDLPVSDISRRAELLCRRCGRRICAWGGETAHPHRAMSGSDVRTTIDDRDARHRRSDEDR
jgi:Precorrin-2 methylase